MPKPDERAKETEKEYISSFNKLVQTIEDGLQFTKGDFKYKDPVTGELYFFARRGIYKRNGRTLVYVSKSSADDKSMEDYVFEDKEAALQMAEKIGLSGVHSHQSGQKRRWMPGKNMEEFQSWYKSYQGPKA